MNIFGLARQQKWPFAIGEEIRKANEKMTINSIECTSFILGSKVQKIASHVFVCNNHPVINDHAQISVSLSLFHPVTLLFLLFIFGFYKYLSLGSDQNIKMNYLSIPDTQINENNPHSLRTFWMYASLHKDVMFKPGRAFTIN